MGGLAKYVLGHIPTFEETVPCVQLVGDLGRRVRKRQHVIDTVITL